MKRIAIIGASGHGRVVADIAILNGYGDVVFLDDNENLKSYGGFPVIGASHMADELNCDLFVAIGNVQVRKKMMERLPQNRVVTLLHPNAVIARNVEVGIGTVAMAGAVINPGAVIGNGVILNTACSVDHDCVIGDYVHVSVGSHIAGTVCIGECTWIGAGATVSNNISIFHNCMIGAGAVVIQDITTPGTYVGVPARVKNILGCNPP